MIAAIIQARTGSTRFPFKIFAEICGKPLLWHVVERLKYSSQIQNIVIATTTSPGDDIVETWAMENQVTCFRGDENNVLDRYYNAALWVKADIIIRITSDDPLKDPVIVDHVVNLLKEKNLDFTCNNNPPSYPEGLDVEVFTFNALEKAHKEAHESFELEHVTQYFYRHPDLFNQGNYSNSLNLSNLRWTVDTKEDLEMVKNIYHELYQPGRIFLTDEILCLLKNQPAISLLNNHIQRSLLYKKTNHATLY